MQLLAGKASKDEQLLDGTSFGDVPELPGPVDGLFVFRLREHGEREAIVTDDGYRLTYSELADAVDAQAVLLCAPPQVAIVEADNTVECIVAYLACLKAGYPVILSEPGSTTADTRTLTTYGAALVFRDCGAGMRFEGVGGTRLVVPHPDLCVLLSTSGTTGSPKLVRLSKANIQSNAASIATYLGITALDRAITSLPLYYSYGMSVLNSHLHAGASVLLTRKSVADPAFWTFFEKEGATSLSGVPFTFDLLERIGFRSQHYPTLRYLAQAGGRLAIERVRLYAGWARASGRQMFVMYGQTEASPRMAYVPPAQLLDNPDAIGIAVPGGSFELHGEDGQVIDAIHSQGELVYRGPNVMMGYALSASDLAKGAETPLLRTGDLACRKENGCYYIVGRKSRFSKIAGLRVSLDEIERWIGVCGLHGITSGDDRVIVVAHTQADAAVDLKQRLVQRFGLPPSALVVLALESLPTLPSGKFDYCKVLSLGHAAIDTPLPGPASLLAAYRDVLGNADVRPGDSFLDLGGDSINLVELSLVLETYLGAVPDNWEARSIASLEALKPQVGAASAGPAQQEQDGVSRQRGGILQAGLVALAVLFAGEAALQARSYLKTGRSAINMVTGESRVVMNEGFGVRTYRPNLKDPDPGDDVEFVTNALGLRSPAIAPLPAPGELRIAVVGASTVSGAYAKTNSVTFPQLLEARLRQAMPGRLVNVINAGIEGYTVREMEQLVERAIIPLRPDLVLIYPGFNDMAHICRTGSKAGPALQAVGAPTLPGWVLTRELISKNTLGLRETPARVAKTDLRTRFPAAYRQGLDSMVGKLKAAGVRPVLLTVARAFKPDDGAAGKRLAATALFYNPCLDYAGLIEAGGLFNQAIVDVARLHEASLIDLGRIMPSGSGLFVDAAHFTRAGEEFSSGVIYRELANDPTIVKPAGMIAGR